MRSIEAGNRPLEAGGDDDVVYELAVSDELDEGNAHVNDGEGDHTDEMTGATLLRNDVVKARAKNVAWYDKFEAYGEVTYETCQPIACRWKDIHKGDSERVEDRSRLIGREIKQKRTDSFIAKNITADSCVT